MKAMPPDFPKALATGAERVSAWADLLNSINVYPVADGDTGRNLSISLNPLKKTSETSEVISKKLLLGARGNSGNIAAQFFLGFLECENADDIPRAIKKGRDLAWEALPKPVSGTMLSLFDGLNDWSFAAHPVRDASEAKKLIGHLEEIVKETTTRIPELRDAGVVDAGALGMFIFFDGFFSVLSKSDRQFSPIIERFENLIQIDDAWKGSKDSGFCVDAVLKLDDLDSANLAKLTGLGESAIVFGHDDLVKLHIHVTDENQVRDQVKNIAQVISWESDDLDFQTREFFSTAQKQALHIVTDAAGSLTSSEAKELGITLLDSYININDRSRSESHLKPDHLWQAMRDGHPVSTSQASVFERHQHYQRIISSFSRALYLCVGSVYTGNFETVMNWKESNDPDNRLEVIDTGAASGKLGLIARAVARFSMQTKEPNEVSKYAKQATGTCKEYIFLEKLQYLAAGGRLSKGSAFFGDLFKVKPIITPASDGAKKVGVARNLQQQKRFAFDRLEKELDGRVPALILLEHSDNRSWVEDNMVEPIRKMFPKAEILVRPFSLTTGAHTGPGTWAVAFIPLSRPKNPTGEN